jgi:ADP-ribose pyrophosphatase
MEEKTVSAKKIYRGRILNLRLDTVMLPNQTEAQREVVEHPGAVAVVVRNDDNRYILIRQHRYPVKETIWEIPAGKLERGEDPLVCAKRELAEETGLTAGVWRHLSTFYTTPGFSDEIMYLYLAEDLKEESRSPDDDEFIETEEFTGAQLREMIVNNTIKDAKTLVGLLWVLG